jgi:hypothetical protein
MAPLVRRESHPTRGGPLCDLAALPRRAPWQFSRRTARPRPRRSGRPSSRPRYGHPATAFATSYRVTSCRDDLASGRRPRSSWGSSSGAGSSACRARWPTAWGPSPASRWSGCSAGRHDVRRARPRGARGRDPPVGRRVRPPHACGAARCRERGNRGYRRGRVPLGARRGRDPDRGHGGQGRRARRHRRRRVRAGRPWRRVLWPARTGEYDGVGRRGPRAHRRAPGPTTGSRTWRRWPARCATPPARCRARSSSAWQSSSSSTSPPTRPTSTLSPSRPCAPRRSWRRTPWFACSAPRARARLPRRS